MFLSKILIRLLMLIYYIVEENKIKPPKAMFLSKILIRLLMLIHYIVEENTFTVICFHVFSTEKY